MKRMLPVLALIGAFSMAACAEQEKIAPIAQDTVVQQGLPEANIIAQYGLPIEIEGYQPFNWTVIEYKPVALKDKACVFMHKFAAGSCFDVKPDMQPASAQLLASYEVKGMLKREFSPASDKNVVCIASLFKARDWDVALECFTGQGKPVETTFSTAPTLLPMIPPPTAITPKSP